MRIIIIIIIIIIINNNNNITVQQIVKCKLLSPTSIFADNTYMFSIYMDKLIKQLRNSNIGCKIVNQYVGVFCYADDISLLYPSITVIPL